MTKPIDESQKHVQTSEVLLGNAVFVVSRVFQGEKTVSDVVRERIANAQILAQEYKKAYNGDVRSGR